VAHGFEAPFGFDVVIPSIPGFGFSDRPRSPGASSARAAEKFHTLMSGLGYERYAVQGGDLGAGISLRLAKSRPESVIGAHVNFPSFVWGGPADGGAGAMADQRRQAWVQEEGAYSHQHSTRPQTLGYALNDSPAGLAAWILEKFYFWSDRRGASDLPFDIDELLTNLSIYWFTETITSSMRIYREGAADPFVLRPEDPIRVPVAVADFPFEIHTTQPEERMAAVADLRRWTRFHRGGHFAALEEPEILLDDLREFLRPLRRSPEIPHERP
jgi:pimeloyl-ACP methyl ester carboxylesterase